MVVTAAVPIYDSQGWWLHYSNLVKQEICKRHGH